jgi:hypothetical protein
MFILSWPSLILSLLFILRQHLATNTTQPSTRSCIRTHGAEPCLKPCPPRSAVPRRASPLCRAPFPRPLHPRPRRLHRRTHHHLRHSCTRLTRSSVGHPTTLSTRPLPPRTRPRRLLQRRWAPSLAPSAAHSVRPPARFSISYRPRHPPRRIQRHLRLQRLPLQPHLPRPLRLNRLTRVSTRISTRTRTAHPPRAAARRSPPRSTM